jgi:folate-binding protein YgfZ
MSTALRLTGSDVLDLLHRVTTNTLRDLADGAALGTLFCDFRGRLLQRTTVARVGEAVWLLRDDAPAAPLAALLDRQIFRDDVLVEDRSDDWVVATNPTPEARESEVIVQDDVPKLVSAPGWPALGVFAREALGRDARDPARRRVPPHDEDDRAAIEYARIVLGLPAHGHEIVEAFNPFEVNLGHEVHLDKGCFTGQETLQRLVTYESVRRRLARVTGAGAAPVVPVDVLRDGEHVGVLTSAIDDGTGGAWIGLAVLAWDAANAVNLRAGDTPLARVEPLPLRRPAGRPWPVAG